ncbi:MAG TPA: pyruvate kinase, partial [Planctomycetota bacterium]|nr:pyruvate kinase [Planctomycetota bacterium]
MKRRAKIVATLGPASADEQVLTRLLHAGANVIRLNLSHGDTAAHRRNLRLVRHVAAELDLQIPVLLDLMGPRFRLGVLTLPRLLKRGESVTLGAGAVDLPVDDPEFLRHLRVGERVLIADGLVELEVRTKRAA